MKRLFTILTIMIATTTFAQNGKAATTTKTFSRETAVSIDIKADAAVVWQLLTSAVDYPRWNSTVISIEGRIAEGEKIRLKSTLAPNRTFKLKIRDVKPNVRLVWGDGQGTRVYTLTNRGNDTTNFSMDEKIGGCMFPLYAKHIPQFDQSFEQFAADLKKEAEAIQSRKK